MSEPITGSIEGLEIIDSLGGQELALRVRRTEDWQPFRMIRGASETTDMTLSFALHGLGSACVDGVMVRSLAAKSAKRLPTVTSEPGPAFPNSDRRSLFGPPLQR
jgi:DNA-binding transcriptional LysR family regulator